MRCSAGHNYGHVRTTTFPAQRMDDPCHLPKIPWPPFAGNFLGFACSEVRVSKDFSPSASGNALSLDAFARKLPCRYPARQGNWTERERRRDPRQLSAQNAPKSA